MADYLRSLAKMVWVAYNIAGMGISIFLLLILLILLKEEIRIRINDWRHRKK